jgi:hypothetical protein
MEFIDKNASYADRCGWYRTVAAELIPAKAGSKKNDYVRLSLKKVMKSGRLQIGFSNYFNMGIPDAVAEYKKFGVTENGISEENLKALKEADQKEETVNIRYEYYGFFWTQPFGAIYRNKETKKISSETLVFIPCDEDTGLPLSLFCMTQERLQEILQGYELVEQDTVPEESNESTEEDERKAFEEFMKNKQKNG